MVKMNCRRVGCAIPRRHTFITQCVRVYWPCCAMFGNDLDNCNDRTWADRPNSPAEASVRAYLRIKGR